MPSYGPWHVAPPQTASFTPSITSDSKGGIGAPFDDVRNAVSGSDTGSSRVQVYQHGGAYSVSENKLTLALGALLIVVQQYADFANEPAAAVGADYETPTTWPERFSWITGLTVDVTYLDVAGADGFTLTPTSDDLNVSVIEPPYTSTGGTIDQGEAWYPATAVPTRRAHSTVASSTNVTAALTPADVDLTLGDPVTVLIATLESMISGAAPAAESGWQLVLSSVTVTVNWQPPRYRWVFDRLPPLRQFPRNDSLGGSPRQGKANGSTSVQGSTRQGWRGTYR